MNLKTTNSQWEEFVSMNEQRRSFGAATWNGNLVVLGGINGSSCLNSTELYDPRLKIWRAIASMNERKSGHELVIADHKLFAIGGSDDQFKYSSSVEQLDNVDGRWTFIKSMNVARCWFAAVICNNFIYAIGGWSHEETHKTVEKFDYIKNDWSLVRNMNVERNRHAACVLNEKVYVVGGTNAKNKDVKQIECYNPIWDEWSIVGETEQKFLNHTVVAV